MKKDHIGLESEEKGRFYKMKNEDGCSGKKMEQIKIQE